MTAAGEHKSAAQQYSEACLKTVLGGLVLSAIAVGLAERFLHVQKFEALAQYEVAREELVVLRDTLDKDACWQRYRSSLRNPAVAERIALKELHTIECDEKDHTKIRVRGVAYTVALDDSDPYENDASRRPQDQNRASKDSRTPSPWVAIGAEKRITPQLVVIWNNETLTTAAQYSATATFEIWQWRLCRARLSDKRFLSNSDAASLGRLHVSDLKEINALPRLGIPSMEQAAEGNLHPAIAQAPMSVSLGTASLVVGLSLPLLMLLQVSYFRAAVLGDAIQTPGTIFAALHGSALFDLLGFIVTWIPAIALAELAFDSRSVLHTASILLAISSAACAASAVWITLIAKPHSVFFGPRKK